MSFTEKIKTDPKLKKLASRALMPRNQARPRKWVRWFLNPIIHHKGKHSLIRKRTRMDILPWNKFYMGDDSTIFRNLRSLSLRLSSAFFRCVMSTMTPRIPAGRPFFLTREA